MKFPRWYLNLILSLVFLAAGALPVMLPQASLAHAAVNTLAPVDPIPKGVWNVTLQFPDHSQLHALELFYPATAQKGTLLGGAYTQTDTRDPQSGLGDWEQTGPTTFEVVYVKQVTKPAGNGQWAYLGTLHIHLKDHFVTPTQYVGTGEIVQDNPTGQLISKNTLEVQAWFVPDSDPNWF